MSVSDEDVRNAYRFILGRPPENEHVVRGHRESHRSLAELRAGFLGSQEFQNQGSATARPYLAFEPPQDVDVDADASTIRSMVARTASYWAKVGKSEPYWSMGAGDRFLLSQWNENQDEFYRSGNDDRDFVVSLLRRVGRSPKDVKRAVEFGCGVGRCTVPLAGALANVTAIDISPTLLDLAGRYASAAKLSNVEFLLSTPDAIMPASGYDLWFSRAVLPHNPPPVIAAILRETFRELESNGTAIVVLPTYIRGYSFHLDEYMADTFRELNELDGWLAHGLDDTSAAGQVVRLAERHALPIASVLKIAHAENCRLMDIHEEPGHSDEILHIFTFGKA